LKQYVIKLYIGDHSLFIRNLISNYHMFILWILSSAIRFIHLQEATKSNTLAPAPAPAPAPVPVPHHHAIKRWR